METSIWECITGENSHLVDSFSNGVSFTKFENISLGGLPQAYLKKHIDLHPYLQLCMN